MTSKVFRAAPFLFVAAGVLFVSGDAVAVEPLHVYLTWQGNPSTTMTVTFQTETPLESPRVWYGEGAGAGDTANYPETEDASTHEMQFREMRYIHSAELTGLKPNTRYYFVAGDGAEMKSREYQFVTIPDGDEPIRFITGGDMDVVKGARDILAVAGGLEAMFCVVGGDLAYANGDLRNYRKWDRWLSNWTEFLTSDEGQLMPMVLAVGNHEVVDGYGQPKENAPFFFGYFPQGGESYFARQFGKSLLFCVMDSGHIASQEEQAEWLDGLFEEQGDAPHKMAIYHVPMYPSHRAYEDERMVRARTHWLPVFDEHHLDVAFENHDHAYKRTPRLKGDRIDPEGTLYLGDGCFGVVPREVDVELRWYEEKAAGVPHVWAVTAGPQGIVCEAVGLTGEVFDRVELP